MKYYDKNGNVRGSLILTMLYGIFFTKEEKKPSVLFSHQKQKTDSDTNKCIVVDHANNEVVLMNESGKVITSSSIDPELQKERDAFTKIDLPLDQNMPSVEMIRRLLHPELIPKESIWKRVKKFFKTE